MFLENMKLEKILGVINSALLILILFLLGFMIVKNLNQKETVSEDCSIAIQENSLAKENKEEDTLDKINEEEEKKKNEVYVDIKGAVKNPGVYQVNADSIINDVIRLAGGLKSGASTKYTNLSKKVSNEMVITIFTAAQVNKLTTPIVEVCSCPTEDISSCQNSSIVVVGPSTDTKSENKNESSATKDGKVSLNTASKEELMTLSGVGEAKADAIIEYREKNNGFKTLEELMNISGIGEKAYEKIKDNIKL